MSEQVLGLRQLTVGVKLGSTEKAGKLCTLFISSLTTTSGVGINILIIPMENGDTNKVNGAQREEEKCF